MEEGLEDSPKRHPLFQSECFEIKSRFGINELYLSASTTYTEGCVKWQLCTYHGTFCKATIQHVEQYSPVVFYEMDIFSEIFALGSGSVREVETKQRVSPFPTTRFVWFLC